MYKRQSHGGAGKEEELLTIDMFCAPANYQGVQTGWFGKAIKDACNVEVNIIAVSYTHLVEYLEISWLVSHHVSGGNCRDQR